MYILSKISSLRFSHFKNSVRSTVKVHILLLRNSNIKVSRQNQCWKNEIVEPFSSEMGEKI